MSNRRKLRPHETARKDQLLAQASELSADPHAAVFVVDFAPDGTQCSWCDCPDLGPDAPHWQPGYVCDGCPGPAMYVVTYGYGRSDPRAFPVCRRHYPEVPVFFARVLRPREVDVIGSWMDDDPPGGGS